MCHTGTNLRKMRVISSNIRNNISSVFRKKRGISSLFYTGIRIDIRIIRIYPETERTGISIRTVTFTTEKRLRRNDTIPSWDERRNSLGRDSSAYRRNHTETRCHTNGTGDRWSNIESEEIKRTCCTKPSARIRKIASTGIFVTNGR